MTARAAALLGALLFLLYLPGYSGRFTSTDELALFEMTRSLYEEGDLAVPNIQHTGIGADGKRYSLFAPGQSVLALPFYAGARLAGARLPETVLADWRGPNVYVQGSNRFSGLYEIFVVGLYSPLVTGVLVALFFVFERELGATPRSALAASLVLGLGTYVASLSSYFLRHPTETVLVLASLLALRRWSRSASRKALLGAAACAAALPLVRVPSAVYGLAFGGALLAALAAHARRGRPPRALALDLVTAAAPLGVAIGAHAMVNLQRWGHAFASPMTAQQSIMDHPVWLGAAGLLLSPGVSLFAYSPALVLSPWLLVWMRRREPLLVGAVVATLVGFVLFVGAYRHWPGLWSAPGPRYLYLCIPLLLLPLGPWLDGHPRGRTAVFALALLGAVVQLALLWTPWEVTVEHMGYARSGPEGPFLWSLREGPIVGTFETLLARPERSPWIWKLATGWLGHPAAPGRAAGWAGAWGILLAGVAWGLARAVRAEEAEG